MASSINASTTAGVVTTADTSAILQLQTAGTTALTVDTTANVGIGTASPTQKLTVAGGVASSSGISALAASTAFFDYNSGNGRFAAVGSTTGTAAPITLSQYSSNGSVGRDAVTINSSGNLQTIGTISVGNATPSTSGAGITFPATQSASTDANTLDDYEEGTFTPSVTFGGGSTGITYDAVRRIGTYTRIGNKVFYFIHIQLTSKGSSTGGALITGLPFTSTGTDAYVPASIFIADWALITGQLMPRSSTNSTYIDIYQVVSSSYSGITNTNFTNTTGFQISGMYSA